MRDNMKKELCMDTVHQLKQRYSNLQGVVYTATEEVNTQARHIGNY